MAMSNEHQPSQKLRTRISDLAVAGIPLYLICEIVGLNDDTVKKYYKRELTCAEPEVVERIAKLVICQALDGDQKSQNLYMKTKGAKFGWVEKQIVETHTSEDTQALKDKIKELEGKHDRDY
jgi:hypothetical protein